MSLVRTSLLIVGGLAASATVAPAQEYGVFHEPIVVPAALIAPPIGVLPPAGPPWIGPPATYGPPPGYATFYGVPRPRTADGAFPHGADAPLSYYRGSFLSRSPAPHPPGSYWHGR